MYCGKCGMQNEEGAVFCVACGEKLDGSPGAAGQASSRTGSQATPNSNYKKVGMAAVAVAVVLVIGLVVLLAGKKPYEKAALRFYKAIGEADTEAILKSMPSEMVDMLAEKVGGRTALIEGFERVAVEAYEGQEILSLKCLDSGDLWPEELADIKKSYREELGITVSDAKWIEIEGTVKENGMVENFQTEIYVIKIGGSWYVEIISAIGIEF